MSDEGPVRGRLVLEDRVEPGRVVLDGGRIAAVEADPSEASGPWIMPGFVDVHVHGWGGHDAMDSESSLDGMARALLRRGVTSFLPTAVTAPLDVLRAFADRVRAWVPTAPEDGATPLGFNLEGPFISPERVGAQNPAFVRSPAEVAFGDLKPLLGSFLLTTVAPETPGAIELIRWLTEQGVTASLGHSVATATEAGAGYDAGARTTTHLFNAMSGVHQHAPGLAAVALSRDDVYTELIADGHHVDRLLWPLILRTKPSDRLVLVSDGIELAGTTREHGFLGGLEVEVRGDRCTLVSGGALAGSVIALDTAVRNLALFGLDLPRVAAAASANPLALIGVDDRGRIAPGLRADLVELDESFNVRRVMRAGHWFDGPGIPSLPA
ncbi:MAG: N-acetylglucosamine-6-phosphate deacetylase [Candidatus Limnocylindrales bacterium]|jgi:N-acetylglucosamine-6-phosphate deacetylase